MEALLGDLARAEVDAEMTALTPEDFNEENLDGGDEVEDLRNSLREAVRDDNVRPKMQCLMMDSSFSMVTMQGEDSGIAWETTPSRCATPWASDAGNPPADLGSPVAAPPTSPGSVPAGRIIFVMDEELISRRKKTPRRKVERQREVLAESSENISGRPELVEVSQPNVKNGGEGEEEEANDPLEDKEQRLFSLVSEGSEILNIVVPQKLATVDEEESREMVDNLSYLEESLVPRALEESQDYELILSTAGPGATGGDHSAIRNPNVMDPPGAPVARPPARGAAGRGNVDYFEPFTLIDAQAPGGPAVNAQGQEGQEVEVVAESQDSETPGSAQVQTTTTTSLENDRSDTISLEEITSELLDDVFYGGTDDYLKSLAREEVAAGTSPRLPSKPSGSSLFGSQEDILTPIFLPEGPPKIIDPILLEEPKAMAFLYTDLYEEATGNRMIEEDRESLSSEKSFHSRHSDREARGYLEKFVLIDETPAVDVEPSDKAKRQEEGPRTLTQDLYDFGDMQSKPDKAEGLTTEEEITDFFRASDNSSPCDVDPFPGTLRQDEIQGAEKSKTDKKVSIKVEKPAKVPEDPLSISSFEFPSEEPDWGGIEDHPSDLDEKDVGLPSDQEMWKQGQDVQKPVAPPRRRAASSPKSCLDLTPLTPVDLVQQETEEAGGKEQRVEEKETASPPETADEGDGDGEETMQPSFNLKENLTAAVETSQTESARDNNETSTAEEKDTNTVEEETEADTTQTEADIVKITASEIAETEAERDVSATAAPAKDTRQCVIL